MKTIKMQVTYKELCWMLEGLDEMLHRYKDCNSEIEKVRAHIVRKLLMMEREMKKVRLNSLYGTFAYQVKDGLKVKREADNDKVN